MNMIDSILRCVPTIFFLIAAVDLPAREPLESWADILVTQYRDHQLLPALSAYGAELNLSEAYYLQERFTAARLEHDTIAGYKAGLTDAAGRYWRHIDEPVAGILFGNGRIKNPMAIDLDDYRRLMLETELGFVMDAVIEQPIPDIVRLKPLIREILPVVELLDLNYEKPGDLDGMDIIATNVSAASFITGRPLRFINDKAVNGVFVELLYNGDVIDRGKATNVMGDQFEALLWLVNKTVALGRTIRPGHLLITGAMGQMVEARAGVYTARFRDVQDIQFKFSTNLKAGGK